MGRDGTKNLIPADKRTEDELKKMTRNGGIKSGESRRRKRDMMETARFVADLMPDLTAEELEALARLGIDMTQEKPTGWMLVVLAMLRKAMKGDVAAAETFARFAGFEDARLLLERDRLKLERKKFKSQQAVGSDSSGALASILQAVKDID